MNLNAFLRPAAFFAVTAMSSSLMAQDVDLESSESRAGYSIGVNIGMNLESQGIAESVDVEALKAGIADALDDNVQMSEEEIVTAIQEFSAEMETQAQQAMEEQAQEGRNFMEENAQRDDVVVTESGLQFTVLEEAENPDAPSPSATDTVEVHYHGTLVDGTVFDSSIERGEPVTFPLDGVIPGWTEGLQLMQVGDKYRFFIPAELGYGEAGAGPIGPNAPLIFDVELLGIAGEEQ